MSFQFMPLHRLIIAAMFVYKGPAEVHLKWISRTCTRVARWFIIKPTLNLGKLWRALEWKMFFYIL
jgi:hypothetical protein